MRIVVLDGYTLNPGDNPWDEIEALGDLVVHDRTPDEQIIDRARDAEIVLTNKTPLGADVIAQLPRLRFICVLATGYNVVDVKSARDRGIPVSNVPDYATQSVAQHVFAMLLSMIHKPHEHDEAVRGGQWQRSGDFCFWLSPLSELAGTTLGIVGFGRIGRAVGKLANAFGMNVIASATRQGQHPGYEPFQWRSTEQIFSVADVVSLHCPQTDENTGFIDRKMLSRMRSSALLINTARGALVNEQDLADALNAGVIAGAGLDVLSAEPINSDNPLLQAKNCLITPHIAWAAVEARQRLMAITARNIRAFSSGECINVVN